MDYSEQSQAQIEASNGADNFVVLDQVFGDDTVVHEGVKVGV